MGFDMPAPLWIQGGVGSEFRREVSGYAAGLPDSKSQLSMFARGVICTCLADEVYRKYKYIMRPSSCQ